MNQEILKVEGLRTYFFTDSDIVRAVDGVSLEIAPGETLGIVGESGCGKTVTALSIMRLLDERSRIVEGRVLFKGRDVVTMKSHEIRNLRGGSIAMIFQDPMTSLNPVMRIARQLVEAMLVHGRYDAHHATVRAVDLLRKMGISEPERAIKNFPHQFSGGMRQRVMLAMGFSNDPLLLIADEPTTALDVTIQAQILDLLRTLNREFGTAIILISHDLGVVANLCSRIVVMYAGEVVEQGPTEELLANPKHPYTWALINAVPRLDRVDQQRLMVIEGKPPDLSRPLSGCRFQDRCPFRVPKCTEHPDLAEVGPGRMARCWVTQAGKELPDYISTSLVPLSARPNGNPAAPAATATPAKTNGSNETPALELKHLVKHFPVNEGWQLGRQQEVVHAVDDVSLTVARKETVGLVGESGCGKSTIARLIVRLYRPTSGEVWFEGQEITRLPESELRPLRRRIQMIFQDPYASLNPRMKVGDIISEPIRVHRLTENEGKTKERVHELLSMVGLDARHADRFPYEFSGGQRQRIGIARALAVSPSFIVADEPMSSLDVNVQAQIINLLEDLQERLDLTYLLISHNLSVVRHVSDRIVVLYLGKVMEVASNFALFAEPLHPYSKSLISAVPIPDARVERTRARVPVKGEIPSPVHPPSGCRFRTRCPIAQAICAEQEPPLAEIRPGHWAACHFPGQL